MKLSEFPYERVDFKKVEEALAALLKAQEKAESFEEAFSLHQKYYKILNDVRTAEVLSRFRNDIDMTDLFYEKEKAYYDENMPVFSNAVVEYQKTVLHSPFRKELEKKIGKVAFKNIELAEKSMNEKLIPLMQKENELTTTYGKLLATAKIFWEGQERNLSLMRPFLISKDRETRKKAWEKYSAFFQEHREELNSLYDALVKNRTEQGKLLGYPDFTELGYARMIRNCYDEKDIANFRLQVKRDLVPFVEELHEKRRKRLGLSHLYYYDEDVFFPEGNPEPSGTPEEIMEAGEKMYDALSPETAQFMRKMREMELFDVLGRKNKSTGGYMDMLPNYRMPLIFANFNGTAGDIDVITHECGHAFQGYLTAEYPILEHNDLTSETAETHSMAMEFFTEPWMSLFFGERAEEYREMHLESTLMFIPYGTMVDEFQNIVYKNPAMNIEERNALWKKLEKEYRPHLDYGDNPFLNEGRLWQKQSHIYEDPYYYIDYCIAAVNALQYKVWMDRDFQAAWKSYMHFAKCSASLFFTDLEKEAGLMNPFSEGSLKKLVEQLRRN